MESSPSICDIMGALNELKIKIKSIVIEFTLGLLIIVLG